MNRSRRDTLILDSKAELNVRNQQYYKKQRRVTQDGTYRPAGSRSNNHSEDSTYKNSRIDGDLGGHLDENSHRNKSYRGEDLEDQDMTDENEKPSMFRRMHLAGSLNIAVLQLCYTEYLCAVHSK
ncbi:hypothetical protein BDA99DRAFT_538190 [Phascolomyces articulosus]|uniref:Uncharacterized protein n=1 Tax=Phascolomyces articulosus TaxID=60185 RepID=A0AAD5PDD2_9FUNG|nr:hypothetical protein BDA99DRAFT_538190 [Phascolomyces articulosus]